MPLASPFRLSSFTEKKATRNYDKLILCKRTMVLSVYSERQNKRDEIEYQVQFDILAGWKIKCVRK